MTELLENSDNTNESAVVSESPANEATISLAVAQSLADALQKIESYTPTVWVDNESPDIDAAHLNKAEQAITRVTTAMNSAVDVIKDLQSQVNTTNKNLSKCITVYGGKDIPENADMHDYTTPGMYTCGTNAKAITLKNAPTTAAFILTVKTPHSTSDNSYIIQEYMNYQGQKLWTVGYDPYENKWTSTTEFVTKDDLSNYWSLIPSISISEKADMNSFMTPGNYSCNAHTTAKTLSNCPVTQAFQMKVYYPIKGGEYLIQEYTPNDGGLIVRRVYDGYSKTWTVKKITFS